MLFEDYHLFEFEAGGRCYDVPDPEDLYERKTFAARNVRITALIERGIATFSYTYDFGDIIQDRVAKIARRRTLGKAGFAKSQNQQH